MNTSSSKFLPFLFFFINIAADEVINKVDLRDFTKDQLSTFSGSNNKYYIAYMTDVFDVSHLRDLFIDTGPLFCFAGKDLTGISPLKCDENSVYTISQILLDSPIIGKISVPPHKGLISKSDLSQLSKENLHPPAGRIHPELIIGINGVLYDVSYGGYNLYGPKGGYRAFVGKDASRSLAKMSMSPLDLDSSDLSDLTASETEALKKWISSYEAKYPIVGNFE